MIRICQGNDFALRIEVERLVMTNGSLVPEDFDLDEVQSLKVYFTLRNKQTSMKYNTNGKILVVYDKKGIAVGEYGMEIIITDKDGVHLRYAADSVVKIVKVTEDADVPEGVEFDYNIYNLGVIGVYLGGGSGTGADGKSAYQIAVDNGFVGTETEWLASLKGADGKSAYQVAVDNGYVGTEEEWLASLRGGAGYTEFSIDSDGDLIVTTESATGVDAYSIDSQGNLIVNF